MRFGFSNALGVTTSPTELIMSRTLILIAAASLVVIRLALSAHAQQLPNATPSMVEMTEQPTPAPAGFNHRTNGFTEQAQFDRDRKAFEEVETMRTANMIRTAPLWGLRVRPQLLHDGSALTTEEAILRHSVQAKDAKEAFERLSREDKQRLLIFLKSL
jgi:hypothetical protein